MTRPPTTQPTSPPWSPLDLSALGPARERLIDALPSVARAFADAARPDFDHSLDHSLDLNLGAYTTWLGDVLHRGDALAERRVALAEHHRHAGVDGPDALVGLASAHTAYLSAMHPLPPGPQLSATRTVGAMIAREAAVVRWAEQQHATRSTETQTRLAAVGLLAGNIGHELRNPLGVIESSAFLLRRKGPTDPASLRHLDKISRQVSVSRQIIDDLLALARNSPPRCDSLSPHSAVEHAMEAAALPPEFEVRHSLDADARVDADPGLLQRVLVNVLQNAAHAMRTGGVIDISTNTDQHSTTLVVEDDGPGFPDELLATLFEPLVTGDHQGTGLGLALVQSVLERHGGSASATNRAQGGARIELRFPHAR